MTDHDDQPIEIRREGVSFGMTDSRVLTDPALSVNARLLYAILTTYASAHRDAYPGLPLLGRQMGCSRSTLLRSLRDLKAAGVLEVRPRFGAKGEQRSSLYVLHDLQTPRVTGDTPSPRVTGDTPGRVTSDTAPRVTGDTHNKTTENNTTKNNTTPGSADASPPSGVLPGMPSDNAKTPNVARDLTQGWWDRLTPKPAGKRAFPAAMGVVKAMLETGWSIEQVRAALLQVDPPLSTGRMEWVLRGTPKARNGHTPVSDFSDGQGWYAEDRKDAHHG